MHEGEIFMLVWKSKDENIRWEKFAVETAEKKTDNSKRATKIFSYFRRII